MVFSSTEFVCFFLPIVLLLYYVVSIFEKRTNVVKNVLLLISSLIFYAWGEPKYILLMLFSIVANYLFGLLVGKWRSKWLVALSVIVNLGCLGVFKYFNFFMDNIMRFCIRIILQECRFFCQSEFLSILFRHYPMLSMSIEASLRYRRIRSI